MWLLERRLRLTPSLPKHRRHPGLIEPRTLHNITAPAVALKRVGEGGSGRAALAGAMSLGVLFLVVKAVEYADLFAAGYGLEDDGFFTLYFLITGFHALHVVMGIAVLGIVLVWNSEDNVETGTAFWHMVDLIWVLVFPIIYLLR